MKRIAVVSPLLVLAAGCFYLVQQTPEPVLPGEVTLGPCAHFGPGWVIPDSVEPGVSRGAGPSAELGGQLRIGIAKNLDAGLRVSLPPAAMIDLKYLLMRKPFLLTIDPGFAYVPPYPTGMLYDEPDENSECFAGYLTLLAGSEQFFGGPRLMGYFPVGQSTEKFLLGGLMLGASFGRTFRLLPELNLLLHRESDAWDVLLALGIGAQFRLRRISK